MKLYLLLSHLSTQEWRLLRKAVNSSFFNTNKQVVQLYELLNKQQPPYKDSNKTRRQLFKRLFPKRSYAADKLFILFSNLSKIVEQVLLFSEQAASPFDRNKRLHQIYSKRKLAQFYKNGTENLLKDLDQQTDLDVDHFYERFVLLRDRYFHSTHNKYQKEDTTLSAVSNNLDAYYLLQKMRIGIALKSRNQVLQTGQSRHNLLPFRKRLIALNLLEKPLFSLYLKTYELFDKDTLEDFQAYEQAFLTQFEQLVFKDQQILYFAGLNFLIRQKNKRKLNSGSMLLSWFKLGIKHQLIIEDGIISEAIFTNIIINAVQLHQYEWVANFIDQYQSYLENQDKDGLIIFYKSLLYFKQGNWDHTLEFLNQHKHLEAYPPRLRMIKIQALFEKFLLDTGYWIVLDAQLNAFEAYIRRNTFYATGKLVPHLNFVKITRQLANKLLAKEDHNKIGHWLSQQLSTENPCLSKQWLLSKVAM